MNKYHVAYFIASNEGPKLSGITLNAENISEAESKFLQVNSINLKSKWKVNRNQIKYIIKLN
jgi:hypothetical protein